MPLCEALSSNFRGDKNLGTSFPLAEDSKNGQTDLSVYRFRILIGGRCEERPVSWVSAVCPPPGFSDQCKEIEETNRMGKTRDLFKNIRDTKGIFHAKVGSIKDRNGMDLTEAEDIKKRWQEYTKEELYKKDLHDPDKHATGM